MKHEQLIELTAEIVTAHVAHNKVKGDAVPKAISEVYEALSTLGVSEPGPEPVEPFTTVRKSIRKDHLVCLHCGKKAKLLKRHLMTAHEQTPFEYRETFDLPSDYPMVSEQYALKRRDLAFKIGLGQKGRGRSKK